MANKFSLSYTGVVAPSPPDFVRVKRAPTTHDRDNYNIGDLWLDESPIKTGTDLEIENLYILVSKIGGNARWISFYQAGLNTLTGDTGGAVEADADDNIDVLGTAGLTSTVGDPAAYSLTIDLDGSVPNLFKTAGGDATPIAHELQFVDSADIVFAGAGNQITAGVSGIIATTYDADVGSATPAANILNILGGTNIDTSAAGSTVTVNLSGDVVTSVITDAGTVTPVNGEIEILGGTSINTSGAGNTVTVNDTSTTGTINFISDTIANILNVTGAGALYTVAFDRVVTGAGGGFDITTGIFTAPSAGLYSFHTSIVMENLTAAMTQGKMAFRVTGTGPSVGEWVLIENNAAAVRVVLYGGWLFNGSCFMSLDANDQVSVEVQFSNGAGNTADVSIGTGGPPGKTWFSGVKIL